MKNFIKRRDFSCVSNPYVIPEKLDERRNAAGLEDGEQSLSVVREVVESAGDAAHGLRI